MNLFLGCDVAKAKLDLSLINEHGVEQWADKVPNEMSAISAYLLTLTGHYIGDELTCVVEATGCYHYALLDACQAVGIPCRVYVTRSSPNKALKVRYGARKLTGQMRYSSPAWDSAAKAGCIPRNHTV